MLNINIIFKLASPRPHSFSDNFELVFIEYMVRTKTWTRRFIELIMRILSYLKLMTTFYSRMFISMTSWQSFKSILSSITMKSTFVSDRLVQSWDAVWNTRELLVHLFQDQWWRDSNLDLTFPLESGAFLFVYLNSVLSSFFRQKISTFTKIMSNVSSVRGFIRKYDIWGIACNQYEKWSTSLIKLVSYMYIFMPIRMNAWLHLVK